MCKFCEVKKGDVSNVASDSVKVSVGSRDFGEQVLTLYINHMNDEYSLSADYLMDDKWPVASVARPISYCPFCGRELKDEVEK